MQDATTFPCSMCDAKFATRTQLQIHKHNVHEQGQRQIEAEPSPQSGATSSEAQPEEPREVL